MCVDAAWLVHISNAVNEAFINHLRGIMQNHGFPSTV